MKGLITGRIVHVGKHKMHNLRKNKYKSLRSYSKVVSKTLRSVFHAYKNLTHKINHCRFTLSRDIEMNPGPPMVMNSSKTICAPYSQANIALFGLNAGRQCVAMSLCALVYKKHWHAITSSADLLHIMNVRNELYSVLSRLHNHDFLIMTELPNTVTIFEHNYEMQYSPSCTGNINDIFSSIDFDFCMPFGNAIQILMGENYHMFLMTLQCNALGINCDENGKFRYLILMQEICLVCQNPQGTCILLHIDSVSVLIKYFQNLHLGCDSSTTNALKQ